MNMWWVISNINSKLTTVKSRFIYKYIPLNRISYPRLWIYQDILSIASFKKHINE